MDGGVKRKLISYISNNLNEKGQEFYNYGKKI